MTQDTNQAVLLRLDGLISLLEQPRTESVELLSEHIHSARTYWLGAMPKEFAVALEDARGAAAELKDEGLRDVVDQAIGQLAAEVDHASVT